MRFIQFILIVICCSLGLRGQEIETLKANIEKYLAENNKVELANNYNKLGYLYWQKSNYQEAVKSYELSYLINSELGNKNAQRIVSGYLGLINLEMEKYDDAVKYLKISLGLNLEKEKWQEAISDYYNIASAYQMLKDYKSSNEYAQQALEKSIEINNLESAKSCNLLMANNYEKMGDNKSASDYFSHYNTLVKHLQQQQVAQLKTEKTRIQSEKQRIQTEKQQIQDEKQKVEEDLKSTEEKIKEFTYEMQLRDIERREQERKQKANIRYLLSIIGFILVILLLFLFQNRHRKVVNRRLKDQNVEIEKKNKEIERQRDLADKQRRNLTSSIQYARRIQSAVIPKEESLHNHFKDSFILYKPRDIVSGDFYWYVQKDNLLIIAAADCTGHGVPGAFMSMLGVAYLNEIVNKIAINIHINALNADEILNQLRDKVITSLHQSENKRDPKDGMDIALCIVDFEKKKLQFAGAYNPLLIIRKGEIIELKGDKMPVSYHRRMNVPFNKKEIELLGNDSLYIFTDGFTDQFGGVDGHKFLMKRFKKKLLEIHKKPMQEQKRLLEKEFDNWRGEFGQIDDVLIIGFRFMGDADASSIEWSEKTILVAEDTDINYFLLVEVLKKTKANIIRVKNGMEAIELVQANDVDLVLMDINMPKMDGYEATRQIKEYNRNIPVIIQTAVHENGKAKSMEVGADDFISKPIDLKTFMNKLSQFLS